MPTPTPQEERWRALVLAVRSEFWNAGQDPNSALQTMFEMRMLRGLLAGDGDEREWYTRLVHDEELAAAHAPALAREFFAGYRAARARLAGG